MSSTASRRTSRCRPFSRALCPSCSRWLSVSCCCAFSRRSPPGCRTPCWGRGFRGSEKGRRMPEGPQETLVERTLTNLASAWRDIAQSAARTVGLAQAPAEASPESLERLLRDCLEARGGEVPSRMRAAALGPIHLEQDAEGRQRDRKRGGEGKRGSVRVDYAGRG